MSIVRWGRDGSSVYIIGTDKGWECVSCKEPDSFVPYDDLPKFLDHLQQHRAQGECVPEYVERGLFWYYNADGSFLSDDEIREKADREYASRKDG